MSEHIKKLAEHAGMEWDTHIWCWLANPPHLEKFAELVRQDYLRELRELKPVARVNSEGFIVELGLGLSSGTKLYAFDEVTK